MLYKVKLHKRDQMEKIFCHISARRDNAFCHECRFCCTLSVCTNEDGTYFRESSDKNLHGSENKVLKTYPM